MIDKKERLKNRIMEFGEAQFNAGFNYALSLIENKFQSQNKMNFYNSSEMVLKRIDYFMEVLENEF